MTWTIDRWPLDEMRVTSPFGPRVHPISGEVDSFHSGVDIGAPEGTPLYAVVASRVVDEGWDAVSGRKVILEDKAGRRYGYAHMASVSVVDGEELASGAVIGTVGETGSATGPHLHWRVAPSSDAKAIDPMTLKVRKRGRGLVIGVFALLGAVYAAAKGA